MMKTHTLLIATSEEQGQSESNEEGIYEEPSNLVEYLQIVGEESKAAINDQEK